MYLFCPKCHTQHPATGRCPKCSSRLLSPIEAAEVMERVVDPGPQPIQTTYARRIIVGCVVALGLHLAFREWSIGGLELVGQTDAGSNTWLNFTLRVLGTVVGGLLAGAGRRQGFWGGVVVGTVSGFAWVAVDTYPHIQLDLTRLGLAVAVAVVGGVAAVVGQRMWPAPIELPVAHSPRNSSLLKLKAGEGQKEKVYPISWVRIVLGATVAVCGVMAADTIRDGMATLPRGLFNLSGAGATQRIDTQIAGFLVLFGGLIAGAGTGVGLRHGLITGMFAGVGLIAVSSLQPDGVSVPVQYVIDSLGLAEMPREAVAAAGGIAFGVVAIGGWLGGQLFPRLSRRRKLDRD